MAPPADSDAVTPLATVAAPSAWALPSEWFPRQNLAVEDAKATGIPTPYMMLARDKNASGAKVYAWAATLPRGELPPGHVYEIAFGKTLRRIFLDVEWIKETYPELVPDAVIQTLRDEVEALHGTGALPVQIASASGDTSKGFKFSFHIVFSMTRLTFKGLATFMTLLRERLRPFNYPAGVPDDGIYGNARCMRTLGQSKFGSDRVLVPYAGSSDDVYDHLWLCYDDVDVVTWADPTPPALPPRPTFASTLSPELGDNVEIRVDLLSIERASPPALPPRPTFASTLSPELVDNVEIRVDLLSIERATNYAPWFKTLCALHNIGEDAGDAMAFFDLADKWSRKASNYDAKVFEYKWGTIRREPGAERVGMTSLDGWAKLDNPNEYEAIKPLIATSPPTWDRAKGAFANIPRPATSETTTANDDVVGATVALLPDDVVVVPTVPSLPDDVWSWKPTGREPYALVKERFEQYNFKFAQLVSFGRFKRGSSIPTFNTEAAMKTTYRDWHSVDDKDSNFITLWMNDVKKRTYETADFAPPPCTVPPYLFNTFYGFAASHLTCAPSADMSVIVDFVDMLGGRDVACTKYLLDWMAALVQRPAVKSDATTIMLFGEQGVGKSMLVDFLGQKIIGNAYYKCPQNYADTVFGRFADAMENTVLLFMDECRGLQKYNEKLKGLVTGEEITIERKGLMPVTGRNAAHFMFASNNEYVLKIENTDRRHGIMHASSDKIGNKSYFAMVKAWMDAPTNQRGFYDFLMTRDISDVNFVSARPATKMYVNAKLDSLPLLTKWLIERVKDAVAADDDAVVTLEKTREQETFREWAKTNGARDTVFSDTIITQHVKKLGVLANDNIKVDRTRRAYRYNWAAIRAKIVEVTRMDEDVLFPKPDADAECV